MRKVMASVTVALMMAAGCAAKKEPTHVPASMPAPKDMTDVNTRMTELQQRAVELRDAAAKLPGANPQEDRKLVIDAFNRGSQALVLLGGPKPNGAFRQQIRIIDQSRQRLTAMAADVEPDATIDTGLRAMDNALQNVQENLFPTDPQVKKGLADLENQIGQLDSVRGPLHSLVVGQVFTSASRTIIGMSNTLARREDMAPPKP